jgi:hypothetical protein
LPSILLLAAVPLAGYDRRPPVRPTVPMMSLTASLVVLGLLWVAGDG